MTTGRISTRSSPWPGPSSGRSRSRPWRWAVAARLAGRHRPRLAYTLWMLVLLKALVPPVMSSPTGVFSWVLAGRLRAMRPGDDRASDRRCVPRPRACGPAALRCRRPGSVRRGSGLGNPWLRDRRAAHPRPHLADRSLGLARSSSRRRASSAVGGIRRTSREADPDLADRPTGLARRWASHAGSACW